MNLFDQIYLIIYSKVVSFVKSEKGAVDIVAVVVLIGIAVALAVLFRTEIEKILKQMFEGIGSKVGDATK